MFESLAALATRRPVAISVFALAVALVGVLSWRELPVDLLPDLESPTVVVSVRSGNRPPVEMEQLYGRPVEQLLFTVRGIREISQVARTGRLIVTVTFDWDTDPDLGLIDVQKAVGPLEADPAVNEVLVRRFDPRQSPILTLGLVAPTGQPDLADLRRLARRQVAPALERLAGVAEARITGGREEEVRVLADRYRMEAFGVSLKQLEDRLQAENVDISAGTLEEGSQVFVVRGMSRFRNAEDVANVVVRYLTDGSGGRRNAIRVSDIADVQMVAREIDHLVRVDGTEGVGVAIYKEAGANTVAVSATVQEALTGIAQDLPNVEVREIVDEAALVVAALDDLETAAIAGIVLAVLVLAVFLRSAGATLVVATAVPVSIFAALFLMRLGDRSLNVVTLGGLALGAGMLVDNAIVVVESIYRRLAEVREQGGDGEAGGMSQAAIDAAVAQGTGRVAGAITATTLTTCVVFLPVLFVEGLAARLIDGIAFAVVVSLLASLAVAVFLIPALGRWFLRPERPRPDATGGLEEPSAKGSARGRPSLEQPSARGSARGRPSLEQPSARGSARGRPSPEQPKGLLQRAHSPGASDVAGMRVRLEQLVSALLGRPFLVVLVALVLAAVAIAGLARLGTELLPPADPRQFSVRVVGPSAQRVESTSRAVEGIESLIRDAGTDSLAAMLAEVGRLPEDDRLIRSELTEENTARVIVRMTAGGPTGRELANRLGPELEGIEDTDITWEVAGSALADALGGGGPPVTVEISGNAITDLRRGASLVKKRLDATPQVWNARSSFEGGPPELRLTLDRALADAYGIDLATLSRVVESSLDGRIATTLTQGDEEHPVTIRLPTPRREALGDVVFRAADGRQIALGSVAQFTQVEGAREIFRRDQRRVAQVTAQVADGFSQPEAVAAVRAALVDAPLPPGITTRLRGDEEERARTFGELRLAGALALVLVLMVLASAFESLLQPITVLASIPLALIGVAVVLVPLAAPLGVVAMLGLIVLAGVAVNDAVLLLATARQLMADGIERKQALVLASGVRLRPIVMTTLTTALALTPLVLGTGEGAELRAPMALTIIGGIIASTAGSLLVLPCLYLLLDDLRLPRWLRRGVTA